jgi:uncharacterized membrane protein YcaP (DUF421 family)
MKPEEIKLGDWQRIFFGEVPPSFFLEVVIRTIFFFLLLVIAMRILGKRMSAQINRIEMVAVFTLAAAVGVPLQAPDRGILPAVIIATIVVVLGRLISRVAFTNEKVEMLVEDRLSILANEGVLDLKKMKGTRLTVERIFAQLRGEGIRHLGEVKRLYVEANGSFSLVREEKPDYGLAIIPDNDKEFLNAQQQSPERVCRTCGHKKAKNPEGKVCNNCRDDKWVNGIS